MNRITAVTRDCFDALMQVRRADAAALPRPEAMHQQFRRFVDQMYTRAAQAGVSREDTDDVAYAIVALADEVLAARSDEMRDFWAQRSLQLHYFHENVAGEAFFTRLAQVRKDPRRREVLQVYALALLFGFQGRYRVRGGELELLSLQEEVQRELGGADRYEGEALSPRAERPEQGRAAAARSGPALWIALGAVAFGLLLFASLRLWLGFGTDDVIAQISSAHLR